MGFVERLREFVGREARLEKVQVSKLGARNTYLLEFTPGYSTGEAVILRNKPEPAARGDFLIVVPEP